MGGKFLKILQQIYTENEIYIKLSDGLVKQFTTTVGVKQGGVFSPMLFNIFMFQLEQEAVCNLVPYISQCSIFCFHASHVAVCV